MKVVFLKFVKFILKNRFSIFIGWVLFWSLFIDENNILKIINSTKMLKNLNHERGAYIEKIEKLKEDIANLNGSDADFEKFVREKYFMKKEKEEVFVIKK